MLGEFKRKGDRFIAMSKKNTVSVEMSLEQLEELFKLFDCDFISYTRDCDIDNIAYLEMMCQLWRKMKTLLEEHGRMKGDSR